MLRRLVAVSLLAWCVPLTPAAVTTAAPPTFDVVVVDLPATPGGLPSVHTEQTTTTQYASLVATADDHRIVAPNKSFTLLGDPARSQQWQLDAIRAEQAWSQGIDGSGVVIGVIDSGVAEADVNLIASIDLSAGTLNKFTHGSAVAALAAAQRNDAGGAGAAPGASVVSARVCTANTCSMDDVARGIIWAVAHGAKVINLSLGGPGDDPVTHAVIDWALSQGTSIVAAAGNETCDPVRFDDCDPHNDNVMYPAGEHGVVAVTATQPDGNGTLWTSKGSRSIVGAPGELLWYSASGLFGNTGSGTSFASPVVAGVIALIVQAAPSLTPAEREAAVMLGATNPTMPAPYGLSREWYLGAGDIDAPNAVARAVAYAASALSAPTLTSNSGSLDVSWAAVAGATSYTVRSAPGTTATVTGTSTTLAGLEDGRTYAIEVTAHTPSGDLVLRPATAVPGPSFAAPVVQSIGGGNGVINGRLIGAVPAGALVEATLDGRSLGTSYAYETVDADFHVNGHFFQFPVDQPVINGTLSVWWTGKTGVRSPTTTLSVSVMALLSVPDKLDFVRNGDGTVTISWPTAHVATANPSDPRNGLAADSYRVTAGSQPWAYESVVWQQATTSATSVTLPLDDGVMWGVSVRASADSGHISSLDRYSMLLPLDSPPPPPQHVAVDWDPLYQAIVVSFDTDPAIDRAVITTTKTFAEDAGTPVAGPGGRSYVELPTAPAGITFAEPLRLCVLTGKLWGTSYEQMGAWSTGVSFYAGAHADTDSQPCTTLSPPVGDPPAAPTPSTTMPPLPPDSTQPPTTASPPPTAPDIPVPPGNTVPPGPGVPDVDRFEPIAPLRFADTRVGGLGSPVVGRVPAGGVLRVDVAGRGGLSAAASAVTANITAVNPSADGFLTAYACGTERPLAASVNYTHGSIDSNGAFVGLGGGALCVYTMAETDIVVDVTGVFIGAAAAYHPLTPARVSDTRPTSQRLAAGGIIQVHVAGNAGVAADATAVTLNATAVDPSGPGFVTLWPCGQARPGTSSLTYAAHDTRPNLVTVKLGVDGTLCAYSMAPTDLVLDAVGWWGTSGAAYHAFTPSRVADTRDANPSPRLAVGGVLRIDTRAGGHLPADATAVAANITVVNPDSTGFVTAWPCDQPRPTTSSGNFAAKMVRPNGAVVTLAADGTFCIYTMSATDLVVDLTGYWSP